MRACDKQAATSYNAATLLPSSSSRRHHHARETASPWCIGVYNPSPRIDRQSWGCGRMCLDYSAPSPTATRTTTLTVCSALLSVVVLAAAECDSVVTTRACCHRLPIYDHHHAPSLLFRCRKCFCYFIPRMLSPIPGYLCV